MIKNYIKTAITNMTRNKVYTLINVFGLSIGLACVMLITLYIKDELSFDKFNVKGAQIYRIVSDGHMPDGSEYHNGFSGGVQGVVFKEQIPGIQKLCRINGGGESLVRKGNNLISEPILYADKTIFDIFSFPLIQGDPATALKDPNNVVITQEIAKKYFGGANPLGKVFQINQNGKFKPFIVSAVAKNPPLNSTVRFKFLLPIEPTLPKEYKTDDWFSSFLSAFIYLQPNADQKHIEQQMAQVFDHDVAHSAEYIGFKKRFPKANFGFHLEPYFDVHLSKLYGTGNGLTASNKIDYSYILGGIALFILFIACINFINLSLSRAMRRSKEIGVRKVIGGSRTQLIIQFLGESFILSLTGCIIAILIVVLCLPEFNKLAGKELQASYLLNRQTIGIFFVILIINTLLSGFYPALVLSGLKPVQTLYGKLKISGNNYFGKSLVVVQFVVAIFLVIGTIVMQKQFSYLINFDLGYKPQNIVDLQLPQDKNPNYDVFKNSLLKYPFIRQVSGQLTSFTSMYGTMYKSGDKEMESSYFDVDNDFLSELNIRLISGHGFRYTAGDTTECLVNQSFVKAMGWTDNPIGHIITRDQGKKQLTVIGVTADFHSTSLNSTIGPVLLDQTTKAQYADVMIRIDNNQKEKAIVAIQKEYKKIIPDYPCNYNFLTDELAQQYESTGKWKQIITLSSIMSIIISCLGLFGLATLAIEQRVKEIGVRKVLGASVRDISSRLTINFLKLVFISIMIAAPLAWYAMDKWLQDYPYRISMNIWVIVIAGAGALLIAALTIGSQAIKAAIANPVKSLRSE
jgi:putative ABC transport system permease protein